MVRWRAVMLVVLPSQGLDAIGLPYLKYSIFHSRHNAIPILSNEFQ